MFFHSLYLLLLVLGISILGCRDEKALRLNPKGEVFAVQMDKAGEYELSKLNSLSKCDIETVQLFPDVVVLDEFEPDVEFHIQPYQDGNFVGVSQQVKDVVYVQRYDSPEEFSSEYAALHALGSSNAIPKILELPDADCNILVTRFSGPSRTLRQYDALNPERNETTVTLVVIHALRILRHAHSIGVIHGNITLDSFVYPETQEFPSELRLLKWGLSSIFVDLDSETHIDESAGAKSRRDDYRALVDVVLALLVGGPPFEGVDWERISAPYRKFNSLSKPMKFGERPPYEALIDSFTKHYNTLIKRDVLHPEYN